MFSRNYLDTKIALREDCKTVDQSQNSHHASWSKLIYKVGQRAHEFSLFLTKYIESNLFHAEPLAARKKNSNRKYFKGPKKTLSWLNSYNPDQELDDFLLLWFHLLKEKLYYRRNENPKILLKKWKSPPKKLQTSANSYRKENLPKTVLYFYL